MAKKIRLTDTKALQALIDEAEGRAKARCLLASELVERVANWEHKAFNPSKTLLRGVALEIQASGETFAKAYNGIPMETVVYLNHDTVGWYITNVAREAVRSHSWTVTAATPSNGNLDWYILSNALKC